jgi:hypothetical protein
MKLSKSSLLLFLACLRLPAAGFDAEAFSPESWPGPLPAENARALRPAAAAFLEAMRARDEPRLAEAKQAVLTALGRHAGVPEERPSYGRPIDGSLPDVERIAGQWRSALASQNGRFGWEQAQAVQTAPGAGGKVPRLRVSERQIRALLHTHEAGLDPDGALLAHARKGLEYLLSAQTSGGVFGYPYDPEGSGLRAQAAAAVAKGERQGVKMVERGWVIEDLGDCGLNFDNGMCGAVLLHGHALTGDVRYLDAAVRAGEWARSRRLSANLNYNGFSGVLLARLYRVTRDPKWLRSAIEVFDFGVLSGQLPNGRWIDTHNAKIQYHAILCGQTAEYLLALREAGHSRADAVETHLRLGLDNLAEELTRYGTNNAEESLPLAALVQGQLAVGRIPAWERAARIAVNYVTGPFVERASSKAAGALPEPVAFWLLGHAAKTNSTNPVEFLPAMKRPVHP